ncbi:MAG: type II toxin-antitoxin system RelE/ParE family toxin [Fimbriimonas sp.]
MRLPVTFRSIAAAEMEEAVDWYKRQRTGLGEEFLAAVEAQLQIVSEDPFLLPIVHRDLRQVHTVRFPYSIIYTVEAERIVVFAVFHGRRDASIWKKRR